VNPVEAVKAVKAKMVKSPKESFFRIVYVFAFTAFTHIKLYQRVYQRVYQNIYIYKSIKTM